ncbi:uncharacterized protein EV420DRAFT_1735690 [Desarmillaria tabescens]|uniref:Uncharacterized protein n=1 Tax=Armillaria tabescens TaxID=1929756 RepID=A0AA39JBN0_ARMTA|nr:uncharacterized protein EV420DRAFT_1735690 [Desarmillaria tabescens]KAK0439020.1 hypothetical protein EV420DRAFT_1735690 [Desarmillaria tabescens]
MEIFFLIPATVSPFLGASFLCYILTLITGKDILTWFSTGLFLLATGIHLWMHVVKHLTLRISHLHDIIHYPSPEQTTKNLWQQLADLKQQMERVKHTLGKVQQRIDDRAEAMYDLFTQCNDMEYNLWHKKQWDSKQDLVTALYLTGMHDEKAKPYTQCLRL